MSIRDLWQSHAFWISLIMGIGILLILLVLTGTREAVQQLMQINPVFILEILALRAGSIISWGLRIKILSRGLGYSVTLPRSIHLLLLSLLANITAPGQVGGETFRIYELNRDHVKIGDATALVIVERLLDIVVIAGIIFGAFLFLGPVWRYFSAMLLGFVALFLIFIGLFLLLFYSVFWHPEYVKRITSRLLRRIVRRCDQSTTFRKICPERRAEDSIVGAAQQEIDTFDASIHRLTHNARWSLVAALTLTVLVWTLDFAVASFLLMALGQSPFFMESFLFQGIFQIIVQIPFIPEAVGVTLGAVSLYSLVLPPYILGIFVTLWRLLEHYLNIPLGLLAGMFTMGQEESS
jgi:glycosyltransferase 2 family protein